MSFENTIKEVKLLELDRDLIKGRIIFSGEEIQKGFYVLIFHENGTQLSIAKKQLETPHMLIHGVPSLPYELYLNWTLKIRTYFGSLRALVIEESKLAEIVELIHKKGFESLTKTHKRWRIANTCISHFGIWSELLEK